MLVVGCYVEKTVVMTNKKEYVIKKDNIIKLQKLYEKIIKEDKPKDNGKTNNK